MNITTEDRAALELARAVIDRILGSAAPTPEVSEPPPDEPKWMKLKDYCVSRSIGRRTLDRLIAQGFPTKGVGHSRRVVVADADAWMERRRG